MAWANDFRRTVGVLRHGVAQRAQWRPGSDTGVALPADAFGEEGSTPSVPGPMLRAKVGTRVEATIRNAPGTLREWRRRRAATMIAPNDSFVVRFTPPRAGTFIYRTQTDDMRQVASGLYAPLIVLEPGERWNSTTDRVLEDADLSWFANALASDSTLVSRRAIAKNGVNLPDGMATRRSAMLHIAPGETYDFEITPRAGDTPTAVTSASASTMAVIARE